MLKSFISNLNFFLFVDLVLGRCVSASSSNEHLRYKNKSCE
jgi:hypothetical protein